MAYKNQAEVQQRAEEYTRSLQRAGFSAELQKGSFRDYSVKVAVSTGSHLLGSVIIYYSPNKNGFKLGTHELKDKSVVSVLEDVWFGRSSSSNDVEKKAAGWHVYVDGSWIDGQIGYGAVILKAGQPVHEISKPIENSDQNLLKIRQVAGELQAVQDAIQWLVENGVTQVNILYDYSGIEKWATGEWQAKNHVTQSYQNFIQGCPLTIKWHKVESHTGDRWNERADQLAKAGAQKLAPTVPDAIDPMKELEKIAVTYTQVLIAHEICAEYRGILNHQFARIVIPRAATSLRDQMIDIYNTKKKHLSPAWHAIYDEKLKEKARDLWNEVIHPEDQSREGVSRFKSTSLDLVNYYFKILEPYRTFEFDFIHLAEALQQAAKAIGMEEMSIDEIRFDFPKLEKLRLELKEHMND